MSDTYNGWTNWETWVTNLWYDGFEGFDFESAEEIEGLVTDQLGADNAGLKQDFITAALAEVNWEEIFEGYKESQDE